LEFLADQIETTRSEGGRIFVVAEHPTHDNGPLGFWKQAQASDHLKAYEPMKALSFGDTVVYRLEPE
jgi:hypothetical protein